MVKKIVFGALTLLLALCMVGCGAKKDGGETKKDDAKTEAKAPEFSADKAILAYAQLYAYGTPDEEAVKASGLTEKELKEVQTGILGGSSFAFTNYSLNKENLEAITNKYADKLKSATNVKTTLKKDDKENPVVELTATVINNEEWSKAGETNSEFNALNKALEELKAQGLTDEQLVASDEYQTFAVESLDKVIGEIPFKAESSVEIPCVVIEKDGKTYWAPKDVSAIENFFWNKK